MTGLVHIYCGDGKGKTTAAIGLALRCAASGEKIVIAQFLKDGQSGECHMLRALANVQLLAANPSGKFSFQMSGAEKEDTSVVLRRLLAEAFAAAQDARMLVLDEVMAALSCDFVPLGEVVDFLRHRPKALEVVLTGRNPPAELLALADYVSEIGKLKHPFDRGIAARDGIER